MAGFSTAIWLDDESKLMLDLLCAQNNGVSASAMIRDLIRKAAGEEGSPQAEIREHVAALARLLL